MKNIIGRRSIFLSVSGTLVVLSVIAIIVFGFRFGIEFKGGTLWQLSFEQNSAAKDTLETFFKNEIKKENVTVIPQETGKMFLIRTEEISEPERQENLKLLETKFGPVQELSFQAIGASIGKELGQKSITAFLLVLFAISTYIAFAFRKSSHPVSSWKYGLITLATLFHDALIPVGLFAVLGHYLGVDIDVNFMVAVLVVMGFSVHDTIVVFDRVRENLKSPEARKKDFNTLVNESINQTLARSINTSLTLVLVLLAVLFFGSSTLTYFTLTILIGTIIGTYSSIFIASPLLTLWQGKKVEI